MPGDERRVGLGQDLAWRLEAIGFAGLIGLLRLLGLDGASALGGWLLRTLGPLTSTHRTVMRNLRIAFPDLGDAARDRLALEQWEQTGRTFAELTLMDRLMADPSRIQMVGAERLAAVRESGRPVVFVSGHCANFELSAAVILAADVPCQITYRPTNNPYVDRMIRKNRARYGVELFAPKGGEGAKALLAGLQRGESVALMNDQKFSEGPEVRFFGQPVNAAPGPTRLAMRFGTEIVPIIVRRLKGARFRVTVHPPMTPASTGDRTRDIAATVQAITTLIEDEVRAAPADWFWVHKRWPEAVYAALGDSGSV